MKSVFVASGSFLPPKVVTNDDLSKIVDSSDEWIFPRTGIKQRHIVEDETTADLATIACERALEKAGWTADSVDLIILATSTPDMDFPATAAVVQKQLGASKAISFDMQAVCSGFVYALSTADLYLKAGKAKRALVIGAERMSSLLDWTDRGTCVLFGDGAGAFALEAKETTEEEGLIDSILYTDGTQADILCAGSKEHPKTFMNGREVFRHAVAKMEEVSREVLDKNGYTADDITYLIPHQANDRIIQHIGKSMGLPADKVISSVRNHANTSAASIPLAFDEMAQAGKIKKGDLIVFTALGAGITWGASLLRI
ncbi:MAG: ketoacyl-ACP synthase III [Alphaproteobacteria bacterium]|nr:ketoacyl-ACP synthase III [Alphaproteobacteria bacterium]MBN2779948.1 ketoacyl-ACP synthase III [Alphaproteobacteria bacterium]